MDQYNRIIFVCESGTARSPMAVGIMKDMELKNELDRINQTLAKYEKY